MGSVRAAQGLSASSGLGELALDAHCSAWSGSGISTRLHFRGSLRA